MLIELLSNGTCPLCFLWKDWFLALLVALLSILISLDYHAMKVENVVCLCHRAYN